MSETGDGRKIDRNSERTAENRECARKFTRNGDLFFLPFVHEDSQWELQIYVQEDMLIDGELTMDDSCRFLIQAVSGEDSYVFLDEMIQLGIPEADIWEDEQEKMHIVLRDVRTARYKVSDFVFNRKKRNLSAVMYWMEKESITLERPASKRIYTGTIPRKDGIRGKALHRIKPLCSHDFLIAVHF